MPCKEIKKKLKEEEEGRTNGRIISGAESAKCRIMSPLNGRLALCIIYYNVACAYHLVIYGDDNATKPLNVLLLYAAACKNNFIIKQFRILSSIRL